MGTDEYSRVLTCTDEYWRVLTSTDGYWRVMTGTRQYIIIYLVFSVSVWKVGCEKSKYEFVHLVLLLPVKVIWASAQDFESLSGFTQRWWDKRWNGYFLFDDDDESLHNVEIIIHISGHGDLSARAEDHPEPSRVQTWVLRSCKTCSYNTNRNIINNTSPPLNMIRIYVLDL